MERITKLCNEYANQNDIIDISYNTVAKIFELSRNDQKKRTINECEMKEHDDSEDLETEENVLPGEERNVFLKKKGLDENVKTDQTFKKRKMTGTKRKRENESLNDYPTRKSKRRRMLIDSNSEMVKPENTENEMKYRLKTKRLIFVKDSKIGFKDEDFHIFNESDEEWIFCPDGRLEKNKILTELKLSEKEILMISIIKEHFGN